MQGKIQDFDTVLADNYRVRLMELGFHPGEVVTCLQTPVFGSPKVFRVANSIFSLDDEVASHILITPVERHEKNHPHRKPKLWGKPAV